MDIKEMDQQLEGLRIAERIAEEYTRQTERTADLYRDQAKSFLGLSSVLITLAGVANIFSKAEDSPSNPVLFWLAIGYGALYILSSICFCMALFPRNWTKVYDSLDLNQLKRELCQDEASRIELMIVNSEFANAENGKFIQRRQRTFQTGLIFFLTAQLIAFAFLIFRLV